MSDFAKKPLGKSLNTLAIKRAADAIQKTGQSLPCVVTEVVSSGIVTVTFDVQTTRFTLPNVTIPVQGSEYIRYPIQVGDRGLAQPASVRLGYASGRGGGVPTLVQPANLAALTFAWLGSASWSETDDPQAVVIIGPNGAVLRDTASTHVLKVNADNINLDDNILVDGAMAGFFGTTPTTKPNIAGPLSTVSDAAAKTVLTSIILALTELGLATNVTT